MNQSLLIFRPTISQTITQGWGENRACVRPNGTIFGVTNSCPAGTISFYRSVGLDGHNGYDISTWIGEDVYHAATFAGWIKTEHDNRGGIGVDVVSNEPLFFKGEPPREILATAIRVPGGYTHHVKMRYWHLKAPVGHDGKQVVSGDIIGLAGNTGASSGPHLHFAPKWCMSDGRSVGNDNGYFGAFDPGPYYNHSVTARDNAKYLNRPLSPLSPQETKDLLAQLNGLQKLLITMQKIKHNI